MVIHYKFSFFYLLSLLFFFDLWATSCGPLANQFFVNFQRKARSGDRKREKSTSIASTSADFLSSNKKRSSTDSVSNFIPPTTPTVSTSADFVASSINNFATAAQASAAALLQNASNTNRVVEANSSSP